MAVFLGNKKYNSLATRETRWLTLNISLPKKTSKKDTLIKVQTILTLKFEHGWKSSKYVFGKSI